MTPAYEILANDESITNLIRDRFLSLQLTDEAGFESDSVEISLDNRDLRIEPPTTGAELRVSLGYQETGVQEMGLFIVDEYERSGLPHSMTIRARSAWGGDGEDKSETVNAIKTALKARRTRSWSFQTLEEILSEIAEECGLEPRIDAELGGEGIVQIDQTGESNLHFVERMARQRDAVFKSAGGKLIFTKKSNGKTVGGQAVRLLDLSATSVSNSKSVQLSGESDSYRLTVAERENFKSVTAFYHDVSAAERKPITAGEGEPVKQLRGNFPTAEEAAQAAAAELRRIGRGKSAPTFNLMGNPFVGAEHQIEVDGSLGSDLSGLWVITRAVHTINESGYLTATECEAPEPQ